MCLDNKKHFYNIKIEYVYSNLPKFLKSIILELEELDELGDDLGYEMKTYVLDVVAKSYYRNSRITEYDYKILLRKYSWIYD